MCDGRAPPATGALGRRAVGMMLAPIEEEPADDGAEGDSEDDTAVDGANGTTEPTTTTTTTTKGHGESRDPSPANAERPRRRLALGGQTDGASMRGAADQPLRRSTVFGTPAQ
ncbi:hypothetical protein RJ55_01173 [Drechmeria coniospora]|nr:hypothetical protein RJ55_01173 [Drechmeria coniospora]